MGRFYLDMEFTNGNYYLADILEITLLAEESGNGITKRTIETHGVPLRNAMDGLVEFIR